MQIRSSSCLAQNPPSRGLTLVTGRGLKSTALPGWLGLQNRAPSSKPDPGPAGGFSLPSRRKLHAD